MNVDRQTRTIDPNLYCEHPVPYCIAMQACETHQAINDRVLLVWSCYSSKTLRFFYRQRSTFSEDDMKPNIERFFLLPSSFAYIACIWLIEWFSARAFTIALLHASKHWAHPFMYTVQYCTVHIILSMILRLQITTVSLCLYCSLYPPQSVTSTGFTKLQMPVFIISARVWSNCGFL